jgi:hypothetical protein
VVLAVRVENKRSVNRAENWHQLHLEVSGHGH